MTKRKTTAKRPTMHFIRAQERACYSAHQRLRQIAEIMELYSDRAVTRTHPVHPDTWNRIYKLAKEKK